MSKESQQIRAYSRYHRNNFLALALCFFAFASDFSRLQEPDQGRWLFASQKQYLWITLYPVDKPFRGRHNALGFKTARLDDIDRLPDNVAGNLRHRLQL